MGRKSEEATKARRIRRTRGEALFFFFLAVACWPALVDGFFVREEVPDCASRNAGPIAHPNTAKTETRSNRRELTTSTSLSLKVRTQE